MKREKLLDIKRWNDANSWTIIYVWTGFTLGNHSVRYRGRLLGQVCRLEILGHNHTLKLYPGTSASISSLQEIDIRSQMMLGALNYFRITLWCTRIRRHCEDSWSSWSPLAIAAKASSDCKKMSMHSKGLSMRHSFTLRSFTRWIPNSDHIVDYKAFR